MAETLEAKKTEEKKAKPRSNLKAAFLTYVWPRRRLLGFGLLLVLISRAAGFVLPIAPKYIIDEVVGQGNTELLYPLLAAILIAISIQAITSYYLVKLLSVEAQYLIAELRSRVQQHIIKLPTKFYDNTQSGSLVSRVMTDVEGVRNLVGTGFTQLIGGSITAVGAFIVLIYINAKVTFVALVPLDHIWGNFL